MAFPLTAVGPLGTLAIGFGAGIWDAGNSSCTVSLLTNDVRHGFSLVANAPVPGTYCFRVYDVGNITASTTVTFTVQVAHPAAGSS